MQGLIKPSLMDWVSTCRQSIKQLAICSSFFLLPKERAVCAGAGRKKMQHFASTEVPTDVWRWWDVMLLNVKHCCIGQNHWDRKIPLSPTSHLWGIRNKWYNTFSSDQKMAVFQSFTPIYVWFWLVLHVVCSTGKNQLNCDSAIQWRK